MHPMNPIYLDYNSTSPLHPIVKASIIESLELWGNSSSIHTHGRQIRKGVEEARQTLCKPVKASPEELYWTSGGTEANNTIIKTFAHERVFYSAIEHPCVKTSAPQGQSIPVDPSGQVDLNALERMLKIPFNGKTLVSVMWANNETGVIQPIKEVISLAKSHGAWVHSDAVQGWGKIPLSFEGLDYMSISAHKIGGPLGVGAMFVKKGSPFIPLMDGGGQEKNFRSGTVNASAIIAMAVAGETMTSFDWSPIQKQRDEWEDRLIKTVPQATIYGQKSPRLPQTICLGLPGVHHERQVIALDLKGFSVSSGSACSSGKTQPMSTLVAMGVGEKAASQAIRISMGPDSLSPKTLDDFAQAWSSLINT
jgi:cysteine desulfurase